jgi:hypothetical protein
MGNSLCASTFARADSTDKKGPYTDNQTNQTDQIDQIDQTNQTDNFLLFAVCRLTNDG